MNSTETKKIEIAGKEFNIPFLPFKKNRIVVNACSFALKELAEAQAPTNKPLSLTAIDYIYLAIFEAVNHADAKVTREVFDAWGCYLPDMVTALKKIALQTGVLMEMPEGGAKGEPEARK